MKDNVDNKRNTDGLDRDVNYLLKNTFSKSNKYEYQIQIKNLNDVSFRKEI